jgi:hypothetical protein
VAQESGAQIGILVLRPDVACQAISGKEVVQLLNRIIGVRIRVVLRFEIGRHARETRAVSGEIRQRDLAIVPLGYLHVCGKILGHRIRQRDLTAARHVREQKRGEFLSDGTNLEDCLAIQP